MAMAPEGPVFPIEMDVPASQSRALASAFRHAGWRVEVTDASVSTDDGEDALTGLRIHVPVHAKAAVGAPPLPPGSPRMRANVDVPTTHVDAFLHAVRQLGWNGIDTGMTVTTEDGDDALTVIDLELPKHVATDEHPTRPAQAAAHPDEPPHTQTAGIPALLRGIIHCQGDLHVGEGVEVDAILSASGRIVVGRHTTVSGAVRASGDIHLEQGAVVGEVICGGSLHLAENVTLPSVVFVAGSVNGAGFPAAEEATHPVLAYDSRNDARPYST